MQFQLNTDSTIQGDESLGAAEIEQAQNRRVEIRY